MFGFPGNIDPDMLRANSDYISRMSDDEIKRMASMSGMSGIDPELFRRSSDMMKNMNADDINNMSNFARGSGMFSQAGAPQQQNPIKKSNTKVSESKVEDIDFSDNLFAKSLTKLKEEGNKFFKEKEYASACERYYEGINEIALNKKEAKKREISELEDQFRLNLALSKITTEDYLVAIDQCQRVIDKNGNPKAIYRKITALEKMGKHKVAYDEGKNLKIGPPDDAKLKEMMDSLRSKLGIKEEDSKAKAKKKQNAKKKAKENSKVDEHKNEEAKKLNNTQQKIKKLVKLDDSEEEDDDPVIEEHPFVEEEKSVQVNTNGLSKEELLKHGQEKMKNMDEAELEEVVQQMKSMDHTYMAEMLKAQGLNYTPEQIRQMSQMMTPDMMKSTAQMMRSGADPTSYMGGSKGKKGNASTTGAGDMSSFMQNPNINALMKNPDMMNNMMNMFKDPNNPLMSMMKQQNPDMNMDMIMKSMSVLSFVVGLPDRIRGFFRKPVVRIGIVALIILGIAYMFK